MPSRSRPATLKLSAVAGSLALALALAACGTENDDDPAGAATDEASTTTSTPSTSPSDVTTTTSATTPAPEPVSIVLEDLQDGPPPQVDVVVDGTTLIHDGREIAVPDGLTRPLGSYEGTTYAIQGGGDGDQLVTVADDGSLTPIGEPYLTYNHFPQLVAETGHVLFVAQDRGGPSVLWVVDAPTGEELMEVKGSLRRASDYSSLEPADRAVAEGWDNVETESPGNVFARSADGSREVVADVTDEAGGPPTVLTLQNTSDGGDATAFAFPFPDPTDASPVVIVEDMVLESNDAFLVNASSGGAANQSYVVLRCTAGGTCVRVAGPGQEIQVAGSDAIVADLTD